jgi:hypothetical protein
METTRVVEGFNVELREFKNGEIEISVADEQGKLFFRVSGSRVVCTGGYGYNEKWNQYKEPHSRFVRMKKVAQKVAKEILAERALSKVTRRDWVG